MILLPPDLKDFLKLLNLNAVEYLLVGGYAVGYYGYPRATGDMDIWIAKSPANAERVTEALKSFGFGASSISPSLFITPNRVFRMGNPPLRIEILTDISGVEFAEYAFLLLIAGGLNWLAIAVAGTDLVAKVSMGNAQVEKIVKIAVGVSALYVLFVLYGKRVGL